MPLTQQRMLELLLEAERFVDALRKYEHYIASVLVEPIDDQGKLGLIYAKTREYKVQPVTIVIERERYNRTNKRNGKVKRLRVIQRAIGKDMIRHREAYVEPYDLAEERMARIPYKEMPDLPEIQVAQESVTLAPTAIEETKPKPIDPKVLEAARIKEQAMALATTDEDVRKHQREMYMMTISEFPKGEQERMLARWEAEKKG